MSNANTVLVSYSLLEQFKYWLAHQPPFLGLLLAYGLGCLMMYWVSRSKGYLISFVAGFCYLVPYLH